jgi:V8-like Glu-specific endopeptidase
VFSPGAAGSNPSISGGFTAGPLALLLLFPNVVTRWPPRILLALALTGCLPLEQDPGPEVSRTEAAIVNGAVDQGHVQVGLLYQRGRAACSATLVGTHTVLTAAHCVTDDKHPPYRPISPISFSLVRGGQVYIAQQDGVAIHPDYGYVNGTWKADVAVVRLSQMVKGVTPARVASGPPQLGETVTLVGYGYSAEGATASFGVKRVAQNRIAKLSDHLLTFHGSDGGNLCFGDSGGPAFAERQGQEELVGIHSYGEGACGVVEHDQRADHYHAWIEQEAGGNLYDGPTDRAADEILYNGELEGPPSELEGGCSVARRHGAGGPWLLVLVLVLALAVGRLRRRSPST